MSVQIIRASSCRSCAHFFVDTPDFQVCHPPTGHPITQMTPTGPQVVGIVGIFPKVEPDWLCGEYKRLIISAADVPAPQVRSNGN